MTLSWVKDNYEETLSYRLEEDDPSVVYYYNVEKTNNPYILIYTSTNIEELSDSFKLSNLSSYRLDGCLGNTDREMDGAKRSIMLDIEGLKEACKLYKEQLLTNKKRIIIDTHLLNYNTIRLIDIVREYMLEFGLSLNIKGKVSIKKTYKPRPKTISQTKIKRDLNRFLISYLATTLKIEIKIYDQKDRLYKYIMLVKLLCPELSTDNFSGIYKTECEKIWNNPELAKMQPKKAAKGE